METLLICLLLLYNAWLVTYILLGRRQKSSAETIEKPHVKPPESVNDIVGKSLFKMEVKEPHTTISEPQAAIESEGEDVTDIAVTFADGKDETPPARLSDDEMDEAFTDIRITDVPVQYAEDDEEGQTPGKTYATGASFEEIGEAVKVADNPVATAVERKRAGQIFSDMEGNDLFDKMIRSNPERAKKIMGLMDEISNKPISGEGEAVGVSVHPLNTTEVPADISGFDIRDFV